MPRKAKGWWTGPNETGNYKEDRDMTSGLGTYNIGDRVRVVDGPSTWYGLVCIVVDRYVRVTHNCTMPRSGGTSRNGYYTVALPGCLKKAGTRTFTTAGLRPPECMY